MILDSPELIKALARKYVWWKSPDQALRHPRRVVAQVMDIGDYDDVQRLHAVAGDALFAEILAAAEAGQFSPRSWAYWHYRLGLAEPGQLPPLPGRRVS